METKQLQERIKTIAQVLLEVVEEIDNTKYSTYDGLQEAMLKMMVREASNALQEILNQSK